MDSAAERLFAEIPADRDCYLRPASRRLGISEDDARALADELVASGRCAWANPSKRSLHRTATEPNRAMWDAGDNDEPPELHGLSDLARDLWRTLPPDGEMVTNVDIRSRDEFSEVDGHDLQEARRELKRAGLVDLRSGRDGGGLRRVVPTGAATEEVSEPTPIPDERVQDRLEHELYEPFRSWLIQELDDDAFVFAEAVITARARRQGKWTQPDVAQLTVTNFDNLPAATVELSTYELKRRADAGKLEAVYEAAAHGRWAHRVNLVLEVESRDSKVAPEILKDAERFGLGVYKLWFSEPGRASVQRLISSGVQTPEDSDLDDMIGVVLDQLARKDQHRYRQAVK